MADEPAIIYSVKELISRLDGKLDALMNLMTNKADRADVALLQHQVDDHGKAISDLQRQNLIKLATETQEEKSEDKRTVGRRFVVTLVITVVLSLAGTTVAIVSLLARG